MRWPRASGPSGPPPVTAARGTGIRFRLAPTRWLPLLPHFHSAGFQTRSKPKPLKSFTLAVANSVTPCRRNDRARRAS